jgi:hypothetical protein
VVSTRQVYPKRAFGRETRLRDDVADRSPASARYDAGRLLGQARELVVLAEKLLEDVRGPRDD